MSLVQLEPQSRCCFCGSDTGKLPLPPAYDKVRIRACTRCLRVFYCADELSSLGEREFAELGREMTEALEALREQGRWKFAKVDEEKIRRAVLSALSERPAI